MNEITKCLGAFTVSVTTYLFGGWSGVLIALLVFVVVDFLTEVAAAGSAGELKAK